MSLISGMDEVIAFINRQDKKIKNMEANEKVREELIVELKSKILSKEEVDKTAKVICDNWKEIAALREENEWMLNEKAELKRENEKLKADNETLEEKITCLESDSHNEVSLAEYEELKEDISVLNDDKEELFDAWLYYWSAAQLGSEHSIPMSDQEGGKYQLLLDKLGEDEED